MSTFELHPLGAALGAEITGLDLRSIDEKSAKSLRKALGDYGLLVFRDQDLTPEQHIALAERIGTINVNRFFTPVPDYPRIAEVRKEPHESRNIGAEWHTDHSYDQVPAMGSLLYAREVPAIGGDTLFASMYRAYDALSAGLKQTLAGLRALHSSRHVFGSEAISENPEDVKKFHNPEQATQDALHPVVITHPISGRKALYVNPDFTVRFEGWSNEESASLLGFLYQHAVQPELTYRLVWRKNTLAFWDNRATWHCALNDYHGQRRVMHRVTLEGCELH